MEKRYDFRFLVNDDPKDDSFLFPQQTYGKRVKPKLFNWTE